MKSKNRIALEAREAPWCPALTATLTDGSLLIGNAAEKGTINIVQGSTTAGTFTAQDGSNDVDCSPFTGVTNLRPNLTEADDAVIIDLEGQGDRIANLGAGANSLEVLNGSVNGTVAFNL